jgi:hypothetical protein
MDLSPPLPVLPCPACGGLAAPQVSPGTGPHSLKATCRHCGQFLKWLPKALVQPSRTEDPRMGGVNRVVLVGQLGKYGVEVRYATSGTPCASFTLAISEQGQDGRAYTTLIPCDVWGKKAEAAGALEAGQLVLFEGKLSKRKKGEQWELCVSGFDVTPLTVPLPPLTGRGM